MPIDVGEYFSERAPRYANALRTFPAARSLMLFLMLQQLRRQVSIRKKVKCIGYFWWERIYPFGNFSKNQ